MTPLRSWAFLFLANFMWALQFTCIKLVQDQVGSLFTVWAPMSLATAMLYPLIRAERNDPRRTGRQRKREPLLFLLLAAAGVFPGQVLITWGTRISLASNAALIMLTIPLSTALMAIVFLGEKLTRTRVLSFILAVAGVLLCSGLDFAALNFGQRFLAGNALIFAGTLGSAFYNSYGKKVLRRYSPMEMLYYTYVAMFVILTPLVLVQEADSFARIPQFTAQTWVGLALLTFFHNFLSMVLFLRALDFLAAIQTALCNYLITFFGLPIAALWLGERLTGAAVLGGLLVLGSTLLITVWEASKEAAAVPVSAPPE